MKMKEIVKSVKRFFEFESGYGTFSTRWESFNYFLKQGNVIQHIIDRIKFRWFPKFGIVSNFPSHLDIELASACQMRCPMCYTTYMPPENKGVMSFELFKKIINEAVRLKTYSVKLSWRGEPMLNKDIIKMVMYAKNAGICEVAMLSNGERMTEQVAIELSDAGLDWISFSFDGMSDTYNVIRAPAVFEETLEKIRFLRRYRDQKGRTKPLIRVQSVLSAVKDRTDEFIKLWDGIADRVNFISDQARDYQLKEMHHDPYYVCPSPWQRMSIDYAGIVHQCISDYRGYFIIGDVKNDSLYNIWRGDNFKNLRRWFKEHTYLEHCQACLYCTDNVVTETEQISIKGRLVNVNVYKGITKIKDKLEVSNK